MMSGEDSDEGMPFLQSAQAAGIFNALSRMGERVAALEARNSTEIAALKRDTESIRNTGHQQGNMLQELNIHVIREQQIIKDHMVACDRRGTRLERISMAALMVLITVLGFLLQQKFFH